MWTVHEAIGYHICYLTITVMTMHAQCFTVTGRACSCLRVPVQARHLQFGHCQFHITQPLQLSVGLLQVEHMTELMLKGGRDDTDQEGPSSKGNRRETWAPGLAGKPLDSHS